MLFTMTKEEQPTASSDDASSLASRHRPSSLDLGKSGVCSAIVDVASPTLNAADHVVAIVLSSSIVPADQALANLQQKEAYQLKQQHTLKLSDAQISTLFSFDEAQTKSYHQKLYTEWKQDAQNHPVVIALLEKVNAATSFHGLLNTQNSTKKAKRILDPESVYASQPDHVRRDIDLLFTSSNNQGGHSAANEALDACNTSVSPSHDDCAAKTPCDEHEQAQDINETAKPDLENEKGSIETEKNATNESLAPSSSFIVADVPLTTTAVPVSAAIVAPAACETPEFVAEPQLMCIESHDAAKASKDVHPQPPTPDHADPTPKPSSIDTNTTNTTKTTNSVSLSPEHSPQPPHDITPPASETEQSAKPVKKPPPKSDKRISAAKTAPVKAATPAVPESAVKKPSKDALKENTRGTASGAGTTRIATRATPKKRDDVKTPPPQRPPPRVTGPRATLTAKERPRLPATPAKDSPAAAAAAATIRQGSPVPAPKRSSTRTSLIARLTQPTQSSARKQHNATPTTATPPTTTTTTNTTKQASYTTTLKLERRRKHLSSDAPSPPPATRATTRQVEKRLSLDPAQLTAGARKAVQTKVQQEEPETPSDQLQEQKNEPEKAKEAAPPSLPENNGSDTPIEKQDAPLNDAPAAKSPIEAAPVVSLPVKSPPPQKSHVMSLLERFV